MQVFPPQPNHYLPLTSLLLLNFAGASLPHLSLLALLILLRPTTTQNYCNAGVSIIICPVILLYNVYDCSICLYSHTQSDFWLMQGEVLTDYQFWLLLAQAICIVIYWQFCVQKYREYRLQLFSL